LYIDNRHSWDSLIFYYFLSREGVCGFPALTNKNCSISQLQKRIPIAKLAGQFNKGIEPVNLLKETLRHQACMPGGTTSNDVNSLNVHRIDHLNQSLLAFTMLIVGENSSNEIGLLVNFFDHIMFELPFVGILKAHHLIL